MPDPALPSPVSPVELSGTAASPGLALGRARHWIRGAAAEARSVAAGSVDEEMARFTTSRATLEAELRVVRDQTRARLGASPAAIFDVHLAMIDDPELNEAAQGLIRARQCSAESALTIASQEFLRLLENSDDEQFRARAIDLQDLTRRWLRLLAGPVPAGFALAAPDEEVILVADDLAPADTAQLDTRLVKGFVTTAGSRTSHTAILARALGLPAVVGLSDAAARIPEGALVLLDGDCGRLVLQPAERQLAEGRRRQELRHKRQMDQARFAGLPTRLRDGQAFPLAANVGGVADLPHARAQGAEGIGLFRSEFAYFDRPGLPTEEELFRLYRQAAEAMSPLPVVIRTLDIGGDKPLPSLPLPPEPNPSLGVRALRLCLIHPEVFRTQLRALLRASAHGRLKIMFPLATLREEVRSARRMLEEEMGALRARNVPMAARIEVGLMLEVPAALLAADTLAREVDFLSIGTNDLVQYTFAADRMNEQVAHLQQPLHPAVLRLIRMAAEAARRQGKPISLCGEMAGEPRQAVLLAGLGLDSLSMHPVAIPGVRAALARVSHADAAALAGQALAQDTAEEVAALLERVLPAEDGA